MDLLVDLGGFVGVHQVVPVHVVLGDEVQRAEGGDQGARHRVHDGHAKHHHDPGILLTKPEFVLDGVPDVSRFR